MCRCFKQMSWKIDLMTLDNLDLEYVQCKLRVILSSILDMINADLLTYFHLILL